MSVLSTVVFADISGSTSLYETLGNERATEAVTQVTQWISDTIEAHAGRVVKKLGDGVLCVFGDAASAVTATTHGDAAAAAARARAERDLAEAHAVDGARSADPARAPQP